MLEHDQKIIQNKHIWATYVLSFLMICFLFYFHWAIGFVFVLLLFISLYYYKREERRIYQKQISYLSKLSYQVEQAGEKVFLNMPIGIIIYDKNYEIDWINPYIFELNDKEPLQRQSLDVLSEALISELKRDRK